MELEFESIIADQGPRKIITVPKAIHRMVEQKKLQGKRLLITVTEI